MVRRKKKTISFFAATMLSVNLLSAIPMVTAHAANPVTSDLLVWYRFDDASGSIAKDSSGNNYNGTLANATDGNALPTWTTGELGGAVNLNGYGQYITIPNGVLNGLSDITISAFIKRSDDKTNEFLVGLGQDSNEYMFITPENYTPAYRGAITTSGGGSEQVAQSTNYIKSTDGWKRVTLTLSATNKTETLYLDGVQVAQNTSVTLKPSDLYNAAKNFSGYIGKSFYGADPYFAGKVDDFRIYNRALSADEVADLASVTDDKQIQASADALDLAAYNNLTDLTDVKGDLTLPTTVGEGTSVTWTATTSSAIEVTTSGAITVAKVTRPTDADATATLTATISKGTAVSITKTFDVTVTKILTDAEIISRDKAVLDLGDLSKVTSNLTLPTTGANGSTITWISDNPEVIANDGTVTRPKAASDATVTLTATISKGNETPETKIFTATVTRLVTDAEIIAADTEALTLGDTTKIISNLTLPTSGTSGSAITWVSNDTNVITSDGKITRPAIGQPDATATLTATISSGTGTPSTKQFIVTVGALKEYDYKLTVDASKTGVNISPDLYGIFFEDINHAADGGLYAELIQNRSFEDSSSLSEWTKVVTGDATGTAALDTVTGDQLNSAQTKALKLTASTVPTGGSVGVSNDGYWGINTTKDTEYKLSFFANASTPMDLTASLQSSDGSTIYGQVIISNVGCGWKKYTATIKTNSTVADPNAKFVISTSTVGSVLLDVVSLFPPTFNNETNGLRKDLATMVKDMKPKFMRFPGGCFVEGDKLATSFKWKATVGNIEDRPGHSNLWGYRTTDGMGFHEFLQYCEDIGAEPLYVVNVGIAHNDHTTYTADGSYLQPYLQDALDALEYANGDVTTKYGAMRAANGHPAPFNIKYIEIGNENNQGPNDTSRSDHYEDRFSKFYDAIKASYPSVECIGDVVAWGDDNPTWWLNHTTDYMDEHYYRNTQWFINQTNKYDTYSRTGPKVYVGEYAVTDGGDCGLGNLNAAIGEAAYMTGLERNSDIVGMASYAPLFVNTHDRAWSPDAIVYNSSQAYGTPTYYTQKMFSNNLGNVTLPVTLVDSADKAPVHPTNTNVNTAVTGKIGIGSWNTAVTYDNVKVTNNSDGSTLFSDDFSKDASNWITTGGTWNLSNGTYVQSSATATPGRVLAGDAKWTNYTLEMDATKNSGKEGFMIYFGYQNGNNFYDLNLGGWNNTVNGIQRIENDSSQLVKSVSGSIETGKTYHIKVVVNGTNIKAYLDGNLVLDYTDANPVQPVDTYRAPLYYVSSRDDAAGEIIIKAVNPNNVAEETSINVNGVGNLTSGTISTLTSNSVYDENSFDNPTKVAPVNSALTGLGESSSFTYNLAPNSINIIRLKAQNLTPTQITLAAPTGVTAVPGSDSIGLSWSAVSGATGYNVYRASTADGTYTKINSSPVTTASYVDSSLTASTTYYYKVTAVNGSVESDMSASLTAATSSTTPSTSSDFTVKSTFNMDTLQANKLLDVQTTVTNNSSSLQSVMAIVALYDPQNAMVNMSYISKNIPMGGTENLDAGFKLPSDVTGYKVKVFVWDGTDLKSTTMQPLSNVVTK